MTGRRALTELGASPDLLTADERQQLDVQGYAILDDVLTSDQLATMRERLDAVREERQRLLSTGDGLRWHALRQLDLLEKQFDGFERRAASDPELEQYASTVRESMAELERALDENDLETMRGRLGDFDEALNAEFLPDLLGADPAFEVPINTPRVLAAVSYLIGTEFHAKGSYARSPGVGRGHQALHPDCERAGDMGTALFLIDDMTLENGATRIVPGSHTSPLQPQDELGGDASAAHPRELKLNGTAGQVVVFPGRLWHGGTNRQEGSGPRRLLLAGYLLRSVFREQPLHVAPSTLARLSPAERYLLHLDDPKLSRGERAYAIGGVEAERVALEERLARR
jgi:ectoine hydroxylase-related dioxygenase (phytanoyl-CoA dioxygenase family)